MHHFGNKVFIQRLKLLKRIQRVLFLRNYVEARSLVNINGCAFKYCGIPHILIVYSGMFNLIKTAIAITTASIEHNEVL